MQPNDHGDPLRVVIAGGGVAGLEALVALRSTARVRLDVTLVCPRDEFFYRPLDVGASFGLGGTSRYRLGAIAEDLGARHVRDSVVGVAPGEHELLLAEGARLHYDYALLAVGALAYPAFEHGITFDRATDPGPFDELLEDLRAGLAPSVAVVIPPAASWTLPAYELALLTREWGGRVRPEGVRVTILTYEEAALEVFGPAASAAVADALVDAGVRLVCGVDARLESDTALRAGGRWLEAARIVSLPILAGPHLPGAPSDALGYVTVDDRGFVSGVDGLLAAGDGANHVIKQGGLAAQQAEIAATQIARLAGADLPDRRYHPVLRGMLRTHRGPLYLRAEPDDLVPKSVASEKALWWPPSKLASRRLAPYLASLDGLDLKPMIGR